MTKKGTPTTRDAIRQALTEGMETPDEIQVHLRKLGLDMARPDIAYHKGRIQAEEKQPAQAPSPAPAEKEAEPVVPLVQPENGKPRQVAPRPEPAKATPRQKSRKAVRLELDAPVQSPVQVVKPPRQRPDRAKARENGSAPAGRRKSAGKASAPARSEGDVPSLEDLFAVKALVKRKGGSLTRVAQQVVEVEELAGRMGGLPRLKRCLELLQQLAGD